MDVFDASDRDLLQVTGADRLTFLQGMLTQDVLAIPEGGSAYAALCTAKGGMVADMNVVRRGEDVLLDLEPGRGPKVQAALEKFLIADDAELSDARDRWAALEVWETGAMPTSRVYVPRSEHAAALARLASEGARRIDFAEREARRVEAGIPRFGQDMDEDTLPLEVGLERAISYTKGCYLGQEVIARATYRGHLHWRLARLSFGDAAVPVGTELRSGGKPVGRVTSVAHSASRGAFIGLARLRVEVETLDEPTHRLL